MLIDTPGFNGVVTSDSEVLRNIAFILTQTYHRGLKLAGIIYLHRITDNKVSGSCKKIMKVIQDIVGDDAYPRVVLASTMWQDLAGDPPAYEIAVQHEAELKDTEYFWGAMCRGGSKVMRWDGSRDLALAMVDLLTSLQSKSGTIPLLIQREMVDSKLELSKTKAGQTMHQNNTIDVLTLKFQRKKDILEKRFREALACRQEQHDLELAAMKEDCERIISEAKRSQGLLQVDFYTLSKEKLQECEYLLQLVRRQIEDTKKLQTNELEKAHFSRNTSKVDRVFETELEYNESRLRELDDKIEYLETQGEEGDLHSAIEERERVRRVHKEFLAQSEAREIEKRLKQSEVVLRGEETSLGKLELAMEGFGVLMGVGMTIAGAVTGIGPLVGGGISLASNSIGSIRRTD